MQSLETTALPGTVTPTLSVFELFLQSDSIVKLVMLLLLLASFWSWAVIFDKMMRIRRLRQAAASFEVGSSPNSLAVGDFNGDGTPDLAVAINQGSVSILLNTCPAAGPRLTIMRSTSSVTVSTAGEP